MLFFVLMLALVFEANAETITLEIEEGTILGRTDLTEGLNLPYYAFQGIPYAEPPVRFELPVQKTSWSGVLNCTFDKDECVQQRTGVSGSEDCLFLSVYTRNLTSKAAVLVWIHGGGFETGNASYVTDGPDYLLEEDLVVVQIQYRLGIFGFISTGDLVAPGNLGLKDQVLALQWVRKNIGYFGGDPTNVTIMGQSAGSASVSMQLNSPKSKGLFKGAIMNSGVSICSWSLNRRAPRTAFTVGAKLGIITTNSTVLINALKKIDYSTLQDASYIISYLIAFENPFAGIPYGPVKEVEHETAFFTGKSEEMISKGNFSQVPILAGFTSNEAGGITTSELIVPFRLYLLKYDFNSLDLVPIDLTTSTINKTLAALAIKEQFFGNYLLTAFFAPTEVIVRFINIELFVRPINKFIIDVSKYVSNTYYYTFSYIGDMRKNVSTEYEGVQHAEELNYIFRRDYTYSAQDELIRKRTVRMWSNFCKFSNPTPTPDPLLENVTWAPAPSEEPPFLMNIDNTLESITNPYQDDLDFYDRLYQKYGQGVYGTY